MLPIPSIFAQALPFEWQEPWLLPAVLGLGAAVAAAVLWFYPPQVRIVRRPWKYIIPGMRLLAFSALAVSVARPVALRSAAEEHGVVLVLLDRSRSMSIADGSRKSPELVALADSLGMLPKQRTLPTSSLAADFEQLQGLLAQAIRAQEDLNYARSKGRGVEAADARLHRQVDELRQKGQALAVAAAALPDPGLREAFIQLREIPPPDPRGGWMQLARQRATRAGEALTRFGEQVDRRFFEANPQVQRVCSELERRTRFELACEALVRPGGLLSRFDAQTQPQVFGFADQVTPVVIGPPPAPAAPAPAEGTEDPEAPMPPPAEGAPITWTASRVPLLPSGNQTDIAGAVMTAVSSAEEKKIRGVVVLTDGQQVGAAEPVGSAAYNLNLPPRVPLIAINVAGQTPAKDLAVATIPETPAAFAGEPAIIRAQVRGTGGLAPDASAARLSVVDGSADQQELAPATIEKGASRRDEQTASAVFATTFKEPGVYRVNVAVPAVAGEVTQQNNSASAWVKVLPQPIRVAIVAGSSGPDFDHIRTALDRKAFKVQALRLGASQGKLPLTPAQILQQNVLLLHDVPVSALSREQWQATERLVNQRGGSVIVVAGPSFSPAAYAEQPAAAALLPFNLQVEKKPAWKNGSGNPPGIRFVGTQELGRFDLQHPMGSVGPAGATAGRRWQDLQGVGRVLPVRSPRQGVRPLLRDADSGAVVATELRPSGAAGRAIYIGTNEIWRWRGKGAEAEQARFWQQIVRHAPEEPYFSRRGRLALDLDHAGISVGHSVAARVRILTEEEARDEDASMGIASPQTVAVNPTSPLQLEIIRRGENQPMRTVRPVESADSSARLHAAVADLPADDYVVRVVPQGATDKEALPSIPLHVDANEDAEMRSISADPDQLRRMAELTGGRLLRLDQISAVPGLLAAAGDRSEPVRWSLWDSPWLFAFVVACLGVEWGLRKRAGLV